jgi:hypothetical protein
MAIPAPKSSDPESRWVRYARRLASALKHPLVIAVLAGAAGALLFPWFTRQWQDRQGELALKQNLVEQIATTSTTAVRRAISLVSGDVRAAGGEDGESFADVYPVLRNSWLISRASARAAIVTYFPETQPCWYKYERVVAAFIGLHDKNEKSRLAKIALIRDYVRSDLTQADVVPGYSASGSDGCKPLSSLPRIVQARYHQLADSMKWNRFNDLDMPAFSNEYAKLGELLLIGQDRIITSIVSTEAKSFYHGLFN